jgi:AcrR family transcriptional regulator
MTTRKRAETRLGLTRERVLRAAVTLADRDGIEALSMRSLGELLGAHAMSIYNHVADKGDLLDGMVDLVVAEIELPSPRDPWQASMRRRALSAHAALLRHPWSCALMMAQSNVGPARIRYVDATLQCLHAAGFSLPMADHAWTALDSYVYGFTLQKLNFPFEPEQYAFVAAGYLPMLSAEQFPAMHALTKLVATGGHDGLHTLEFGLDLLLEGLERVRTRELDPT